MKRISFEDIVRADDSLNLPPEGMKYAVISYHSEEARPFRWHITIYKFENGAGSTQGFGTAPAEMLTHCDVETVYLIELTMAQRAELEKELINHEIALVPMKGSRHIH